VHTGIGGDFASGISACEDLTHAIARFGRFLLVNSNDDSTSFRWSSTSEDGFDDDPASALVAHAQGAERALREADLTAEPVHHRPWPMLAAFGMGKGAASRTAVGAALCVPATWLEEGSAIAVVRFSGHSSASDAMDPAAWRVNTYESLASSALAVATVCRGCVYGQALVIRRRQGDDKEDEAPPTEPVPHRRESLPREDGKLRLMREDMHRAISAVLRPADASEGVPQPLSRREAGLEALRLVRATLSERPGVQETPSSPGDRALPEARAPKRGLLKIIVASAPQPVVVEPEGLESDRSQPNGAHSRIPVHVRAPSPVAKPTTAAQDPPEEPEPEDERTPTAFEVAVRTPDRPIRTRPPARLVARASSASSDHARGPSPLRARPGTTSTASRLIPNAHRVELALRHVCLAAPTVKDQLEEALAALSSDPKSAFCILLRNGSGTAFKGLYQFRLGDDHVEAASAAVQLVRVAGVGPAMLTGHRFKTVLKFDTAGKRFVPIFEGALTSADAVAMK
jgi:hypothetical protein